MRLCVRRLQRGDRIAQVALDAKISVRTVYRAQKNFKNFGDVVRPRQKAGRPREISDEMVAVSFFLKIGFYKLGK
jgi:transposase